MNPSVSIIIPVYNVENYLNRCLDSVVNQTFEDIEIICIDDGSTDNSLEILKNYAKLDSRIKIFSQKNLGPGFTRNFGLNQALGEYVLFVDADDWIDIDSVKILYHIASSKNLDLLLFLVENFDEKQNLFYEDDYYNNVNLPDHFYDKVFNHENIKEYIFSLATIPYNKLYKRSVLEKYNIRFPEDVFFEDNPFHFEVLLASKKISIIRKYFSLRRRRNSSITSDIDRKYLDVIPVSDYVVDVFKKYNCFQFYEHGLLNFKIDYLRRWYSLINIEFKQDYWKLMFQNLYKCSCDEKVHDAFLSNLYDLNKNFYLNVLKSNNHSELDLFINQYYLDDENNKKLSEINKRTLFLKNNEDKFNKKLADLNKQEKSFDLRVREFEDKRAEFDRFVVEKEGYLDVKERELYDYRVALENTFLEREKLVDLKEKEILGLISNSKYKIFSKLISVRPKISIIVPVHNAEKYLEQCLDSLVNQTLFNIEVLCMDDGSNDDSWNILKNYSQNDNRFKIFKQKNQGQGVARNRCLDQVSGEYVMFLDADDWLDVNACKTLYEFSKLNNLDMLMFLIMNYSEKEDKYYEDYYYNLSCIENFKNEIFNYEILGETLFEVSISPCQKIYKKELLDNIRFSEGIYFEDNPFFWEVFFSAKRVSMIKEHFYFRRRHESSTTGKLNYKYLDVVAMSDIVINVFHKYGVDSKFKKRLSKYKIKYVMQWYNLLEENTKYNFWKLMKEDFYMIKNNSKKHAYFMDNLPEDIKNFYINTLKSRSPEELEYLQKFCNNINYEVKK